MDLGLRLKDDQVLLSAGTSGEAYLGLEGLFLGLLGETELPFSGRSHVEHFVYGLLNWGDLVCGLEIIAVIREMRSARCLAGVQDVGEALVSKSLCGISGLALRENDLALFASLR